MAMEDAVVLAKCLRDVSSVGQAFATYERLRRGRVERIVAEGARQGSNKTLGPVGRTLRDALLPFMFKFLVTEKSLRWIYDHHIAWDVPVVRGVEARRATAEAATLPETTAGVDPRQLVLSIGAMAVAFAVTLFLPAGTFAWPAGWAFLALLFGFTIAVSLWLLRFNPDLLAERMTSIGQPGHKTWDKVFLALTALAFFAWLALMAFDVVRFHWSRVPPWAQALGALLLSGSFYLFFLTFRENTFLSPAVRVQTERDQRVVSTGPYGYVRHPMYAGFVLFTLGTALFLGSWYGLLGAALLIAMIAWRAVQEERVLQEELEGYRAYMTRVQYRFVPHLW